MKFYFMLFFSILCFTSCEDTGSNTVRAGIIAEDFVKQRVLSADDLEFDVIGVEETDACTYHVVAFIKTLNGLGLKVPRKASIRLMYKGSGDWTDLNNWSCYRITFLNESNGQEEHLL